jgi:hypothetical protein
VFSLTAPPGSQWEGHLMPSLRRPRLAAFFGRRTHAGREPLARSGWFPKPSFSFTQRRKHRISEARATPIPNHRRMNQTGYSNFKNSTTSRTCWSFRPSPKKLL